MPSAAAIHAACFAVGAVVGGGIAAAVSARGVGRPRPASVTSSGTAVIPAVGPPIVEVGPTGDAKLIPSAAVSGALVSPVLKYGHPGPVPDLLVRKAYTVAYDRRYRHPAWPPSASLRCCRRPLSDGSENGDRSRSSFTEDDALPVPFRAKLQDYFRSGYDRGHMVPAADAKISQEAMDETFLMSNIAPQVGDGFNRHYWAYVEDWCRRLTNSFSDVYVFTTYEVIGSPPNVSVPTHFAKVVLASRPSSPKTPDVPEISTGAFILPNAIIPDEAPFESFVAPVEAVERAAGLTLFSEAVKNASKHICQTTKCEVIVRRFDEARKRPELRRTVSAPK
ncbi:hypothetical protein F5J12DRAFT_966975 [Pisolithus orientalis]|uniref:uncharacterized protein n=1 Tax=Pisolithus orientalis TaxID=936130 RepID=UPI002224F6C2|nr:uncharacterized protein F5J12DRAFT_966975 [Pisolithus orientalis]KAI6019614.1 hypothetical protein F5J12DRAFT_966975 [Pisolithus orientalis]